MSLLVEETSIVSEASELRLLMEELKELLGEMKTTLIEMTACGSLGVNMAGPTDKEDEKEKKDPIKDILSRIKKKRKTKS